MGLIYNFTLKLVQAVTLNLFQGLTNHKIPKQVRNDIMSTFRAYPL